MEVYKPFDYQKAAIDFIINNKSCGLFLDMSLGKTVSTLTAIKELKDEYLEIKNVLVIAPKNVAKYTWPEELEKWDHISDLSYTLITGTPKQREANLKKEVDIYITTRDLVKWLVDYLGKDWFFDMLVIDELSSFKGSSSNRFKALKKVVPKVKRVVGLTGTPKPNGYEDLWPQMYLLDQGKRLEPTITKFRNKYFDCSTWGGFPEYKLKKGADAEINSRIKDICISMKLRDYIKIDKPIPINYPVKLNPNERNLYKKLERDYVLELENEEITAFNAAALTNKLLQLSNGAVYTEDKQYKTIHDKKIEALKTLNESAENLLVFYSFKSDKERIKKAIPETRFMETEKDIKDWNSGKIKLLLVHPASCGHGLNLQFGGHIAVWFGLNWSLELYQQANSRLIRIGQKEPVLIYRILAENTVDERVIEVIEGKSTSQEKLLRELKARIKNETVED